MVILEISGSQEQNLNFLYSSPVLLSTRLHLASVKNIGSAPSSKMLSEDLLLDNLIATAFVIAGLNDSRESADATGERMVNPQGLGNVDVNNAVSFKNV